jgi:hypothetical protein
MEIPRCIAIATINGRTIAKVYSGLEDPTFLPPGGKSWPNGEPALRETVGQRRQAETSKKMEEEGRAAS